MQKKWIIGSLCILVALSFCACEKGYAVAIGLANVDPNHYAGWSGQLGGCVPDAKLMAEIAKSQGFTVDTILTAAATRQAVINKLSELATKLKSGDLLVVSYSGHGGQVPDLNNDETDDNLDETWCLYDGQLLDDELFEAWSRFQPGVRILVFSDSCHSGTVLKMIKTDFETPSQERINELDNNLMGFRQIRESFKKDYIRETIHKNATFRSMIRDKSPLLKAMPRATDVADEEVQAVIANTNARIVPPQTIRATYNQHRSFYDDIGRRAPGENPNMVKATCILISGCGDLQTSADLGTNGLFTLMLHQVWNNGSFNGSHTDFHIAIKEKVLAFSPDQAPNFFIVGAPNPEFVQQKPYTASIPK